MNETANKAANFNTFCVAERNFKFLCCAHQFPETKLKQISIFNTISRMLSLYASFVGSYFF